jgi:hypothetical protein
MKAVSYGSESLHRIAEGWLAYQRSAQTGPSGVVQLPPSDAHFEFVEQVDELVRSEPEFAWLVIQTIFAASQNDLERACLAAGPLEDLLAKHGEVFIERIEKAAAADDDFRELLVGVWRNVIAPQVWERLQRAAGPS